MTGNTTSKTKQVCLPWTTARPQEKSFQLWNPSWIFFHQASQCPTVPQQPCWYLLSHPLYITVKIFVRFQLEGVNGSTYLQEKRNDGMIIMYLQNIWSYNSYFALITVTTTRWCIQDTERFQFHKVFTLHMCRYPWQRAELFYGWHSWSSLSLSLSQFST